ncbi:hypothetical protein [Rhodopseudomonas sp. P2A-2r]|uniref:hypothetical protein n=1 Tax=unclassified Rhodopseudomonas TaxID=2638247 RepID=UPI00223412E7|nr:hypothetical protein [Rhodopseudomonas sp. P2A-2r]UZE51811.1 hypothetical protein ONR75_15335 [Rhodopseudomonas sp. P2A-2r]
MKKVVFNERLKLMAGFANAIAVAMLSAGVIGPVLAFFYGILPVVTDVSSILAGSLVCILVSGCLHF